MRLISQGGYLDVRYENATLRYRENAVLAVVPGSLLPTGSYEIVMGEYSTEEKALKVMEMVRNEYENYSYAYDEHNEEINILIKPKVFIFPKDEDVEV